MEKTTKNLEQRIKSARDQTEEKKTRASQNTLFLNNTTEVSNIFLKLPKCSSILLDRHLGYILFWVSIYFNMKLFLVTKLVIRLDLKENCSRPRKTVVNW